MRMKNENRNEQSKARKKLIEYFNHLF